LAAQDETPLQPPPPAGASRNRISPAAALAARRAITTVPAAVAGLIPSVLTEVVAIPLRDAGPATIALVGHQDRANPLVESLRTFARGAGARQRSAERA